MSASSELNSLLQELGRQLGIPELSADETGHCTLSIDGAWALHIAWHEARNCVQCLTDLGGLPLHGREALMAQLLAANALFTGTQGATLALDPTREQVVLCREIGLTGLDYIAFEKGLEAFIEQAEHWRARLDSASSAVFGGESPRSPGESALGLVTFLRV